MQLRTKVYETALITSHCTSDMFSFARKWEKMTPEGHSFIHYRCTDEYASQGSHFHLLFQSVLLNMHQVMISNGPPFHTGVIKPRMIDCQVLKQLSLKRQLSSSGAVRRGRLASGLTVKEDEAWKRPIENFFFFKKINKGFARRFGHGGVLEGIVKALLLHGAFNHPQCSDKLHLFSHIPYNKSSEAFGWRDRPDALVMIGGTINARVLRFVLLARCRTCLLIFIQNRLLFKMLFNSYSGTWFCPYLPPGTNLETYAN